MAEEKQESSKQSFANLIDLISAITAVAGFLYTCGILLLSVQIHLTYQLPFAATWYAATMVPQQIVFGQGLQAILYSPVTFLVVIIFGIVLSRREFLQGDPTEDQDGSFLSKKYSIPNGFYQFLMKYALIWILLFSVIPAQEALRLGSLQPLQMLVPFIARFMVAGLTMIGFIIVTTQSRKHNLSFPVVVAIIFSLGYANMFLSAALHGDLNEPPLTSIEIKKDNTIVRGRLLAHEGDYWHVIENTGTIVAISNDNAKTVTIGKER